MIYGTLCIVPSTQLNIISSMKESLKNYHPFSHIIGIGFPEKNLSLLLLSAIILLHLGLTNFYGAISSIYSRTRCV